MSEGFKQKGETKMENELIEHSNKESAGMLAVAQSRAVAETQARVVSAKKFPRDQNAAFARIIESCKRISLAQQSVYKYPRGGELVTGPSIRLAEVLAQNWGNLSFGVNEIEQRDGESVMMSYCSDLESNTHQEKVFVVKHQRHTKKGVTHLKDPRDLYELTANLGSRRLRACILGIIPGDVVEAAVEECKRTLAKGGGEPIADRIRKVVVAFKDLGVSQEMLEERLGHKIDLTTPEEIVDLTAIYTSLRDKQSKRGDFFNFKDDEPDSGKAADLKNKLKGAANEQV